MKTRSCISLIAGVAAVGVALGLAGCAPEPTPHWQGYLEGEYVLVASPLAGRLETLAVQRGQTVSAGTALFTLEQASERAALDEVSQRLAAAEARLADLRKGQRPTELAAIEARLTQARSAAELSALELERVRELRTKNVASEESFDRARLSHERNRAQVAELEAQRATAELGARSDAIVAGEAEVAAARAAVARAEWAVNEKTLTAPADALVFDTLFRAGEFVPAATPVVSLLPPANLKVRFFVSESVRATLASGDTVQVHLSGRDAPVAARINYLSPQPEFTPPVLYNRDNREKLVFMIEAAFASDAGVELLPGQPVDVTR